MKKKPKPKYFKEIIDTLEELNNLYPSYNLGRHLSTALFEQGDIWGMSNKDLLQSLLTYKAQLETDEPHEDSEISEIIRDGMDLTNILNDDDNFIEGQYY